MGPDMIRIGLVAAGASLVLFGLYSHAVRRISVNCMAAWWLLGFGMAAAGAVPALSGWAAAVPPGAAPAACASGALLLFGYVRASMAMSRLSMQNKELAMQVSLLMHDSRMAAERQGIADGEEEDTVRVQHAGPRGSGDGAAGAAEEPGQQPV